VFEFKQTFDKRLIIHTVPFFRQYGEAHPQVCLLVNRIHNRKKTTELCLRCTDLFVLYHYGSVFSETQSTVERLTVGLILILIQPTTTRSYCRSVGVVRGVTRPDSSNLTNLFLSRVDRLLIINSSRDNGTTAVKIGVWTIMPPFLV